MYTSAKPYFYGTGRRKSSVARVRLYPGTGVITINGNDVELAHVTCNIEGLVHDKLKSFKTEVIVNISAVDCDYACTGIKTNSCYG